MSDKKIAIVTGAFGGIGQAIAERLGKDGDIVICADLHESTDTVARIEAAGGSAVSKILDVKDAAAWKAMVEEVVNEYGRIDYLAAVAGVVNRWSQDTVLEMTEDGWDQVLNINAKGVWLGMQAVLPTMLSAGEGRIVNISSLAAHKGLQGLAAYSASKGAVEALTRQAAVEYGRQGILINAVAPGTIETPINAGVLKTEEGAASSIATTSIGRWAQPDELASAVAFLLKEGSFVSGQVYLVDGGWSITGGVAYEDSRTM